MSTTQLEQAATGEETERLDALSRFDYRSRHRAIKLEHSPPGRYLAVEDHHETRLIELDRQITRIGRGLGADLRLEDQSVSRRHAIITLRFKAARILDDRSSNGTYVNGRRIFEQQQLHDGDVIVLGHVILRYLDVPDRRDAQPLTRDDFNAEAA